jgi:hypothetical protein
MQGGIQEAMPPEYGSMPELRPEDYIKLDKTRVVVVRDHDGNPAVDPKGQVLKTHAYSTIEASERTPEDPHFKVRYMLDGLPFDVNGDLVPDDGKRSPWDGLNSEGKKVTYHPLWTDAMRNIVKKKMRRIMEGIRSKAPADDDIEEDFLARETESDTINVPEWLKGKLNYPFHLVQPAVRRRWGLSLGSVAEVVRALVLEEKVVDQTEVAEHFKRYLIGA